jgi:transglutaminase-like putative cysteine protease
VRRWTAASLLVVAAFYGFVTRQWVAALPLAAVLFAPFFTRGALAVSRNAGRALTALAAVAGAAVGWLAPAPAGFDGLRKPWPALALAGLFAGAAQLFLRADREPSRDGAAAEGDAEASRASSPFVLLPGLVALTAVGETGAGPIYGAVVIAWLALGLLALRAGDAGRPAWSDVPRRARIGVAALLALAAALAAGAIVGLPPLSRWTERQVMRVIGGAETGFSDRLWLGSLDGLLDSDEVVMRLEGPRTDYLRGAVFDHYEIGRWGRMKPPRTRPVDVSAPRAAGDRVRLSVVAGARDRYFLPQGARAVSAAGAGVVVDRFGVVRVDGALATEVSFALGGPPDFPADEPTDDDLDIPAALRRPLGRIAKEWTEGATTPEAKLSAIVARLGNGFSYSRTFQRRRADPILDFLLDDHRGHCEYFATATALLARAAGVPARVVIGYRVAEENALGRYWVVREKNAHAWTEVYLPGRGFVTVDTTPADPLAQNAPHRSSWIRAAADLVSATTGRVWARLTLVDLIIGGLVVTAVGLVVRRLRRPRDGRARDEKVRMEPPPPSLLALLDALAKQGMARAESEPIERFAARIAGEGAGEAAALLDRWAAFRYGGIGDGDAIGREMERCAEQLRRPRANRVAGASTD